MTDEQLAELQSILLDLLRYILAAVVVVGHGFGFFLGYFDGFFPAVFPHPQSIAVVCFFYLSGFLVVGSQIRKAGSADNTLKRYLFDRFTRVYVTLIPCLLFVVVLDLLFKQFSSIRVDLVANYASLKIFIKNALLIPSMPYGTIRPIWSLMYEWWIYLLFGGLFFLRSDRIAAVFLILLAGYYTLDVNAGGEAGHLWVVWAVGGVCAYIHARIKWREANPFLLGTLALAFLSTAAVLYCSSKNAYDLPAGVCLALALFLFTCKPSGSLQLLLPLRGIAKKLAGFSFSLFLTHYTVLTYVEAHLGLSGWVGVVVSFLLSNFVAFCIAYFTEYRLPYIRAYVSRAAR